MCLKTIFFSCILAIEAGKVLNGKVLIEVEKPLDATDLTLEVNGKEKTFAFDEVDGKSTM
jgi:hypothetical protein